MVLLVFLAALALRVILAVKGGQGYWPDEGRYNIAADAAEKLALAQYEPMTRTLLGSADHLGFKVQMVPIAFLNLTDVTGRLALSAMFVGVYSAACLVWIWLIARRLGGSPQEAFWASFAGLCSCSLLYYARHLLPYDLALFWALACWYVGLSPAPGKWTSFLAGLLGFVAFVTYNGYWTLVGLALIVHVLWAGWRWQSLLSRAICAGLGLAGSFLLLLLAARVLGIDLWESYRGFSATITQGDFAEGHRLTFDYLWQTERASFCIWLLSVGAGLVIARQSPPDDRRRLLLYVGVVAAIVATLVIGSNVLHKFTVYGRLVRQVIPFLVLATGWTLAHLFARCSGRRVIGLATAVVLVACAAVAMARPFRQVFFNPFVQAGNRIIANYPWPAGMSPKDKVAAQARFQYVNVGYYWPKPNEPKLPPHDVLLATEHPQHWLPYLYEGFNPEQRRTFLSQPLEMKLVLLRE